MWINDWWELKKLIVNGGACSWLYKYLYRKIMTKHAGNIMPGALFATKPNLPHGLSGIFISSGSKIGKNAVIFHQVTIGSVTTIDSVNFGSPVIGDDCYIGAGAKIIGNITIGNNFRIGANSVVYKNVPDNTVVTNGAQVNRKIERHLDNRYYFNRKGVWYYADDGEFKMCPLNGKKPDIRSYTES